MKFGLNIINFGPGATPAAMRAQAEWAEACGFSLVMVSDHVAVTADVARAYPAPFYEPFTALAWLAGITSSVELGTTVVIVPYRQPLLTARMVANLDQLCDGRFIFGVGAGWARAEFDALNVPFERRGRLTDEYLVSMQAHWAADTLTVGAHVVHTLPRPVRQPHPPVWVGGHTAAAIRRTVAHGDAWHPLNVRLDWLADEGLPLMRREAERLERPVPMFAPRIKVRLSAEPLDDAERRPGQGTLDQVRRDLAALQRLGAEYVVLDTYHGQPQELLDTEETERMLDVLTERAIDAAGEGLR